MKVKQITLGDDHLPTGLVVEMSRREAVFIATVFGRHSPKSAEEMVPGYGSASTEVYDCLTGEFFNRVWEDGVEDAR